MKFNDYFQSVPVLESDRLLLRPFTFEDIRNEYVSIIRDSDVQKYLGGSIVILKNDKYISCWLRNINGRLLRSRTVFTWCIENKKEHKVIGRIDLGGFTKKSMASVAYHFSKDYWNKGFATEAVKEVTRFGINDLLLHRIEATVLPENIGSIRVLSKNGYVKEGLLKKYYYGNEFHDTIMMAVVKEENLY